MADLTPLNLADSLESFLSLFVLSFFKQFQFRRHSLAFQVKRVNKRYTIPSTLRCRGNTKVCQTLSLIVTGMVKGLIVQKDMSSFHNNFSIIIIL